MSCFWKRKFLILLKIDLKIRMFRCNLEYLGSTSSSNLGGILVKTFLSKLPANR